MSPALALAELSTANRLLRKAVMAARVIQSDPGPTETARAEGALAAYAEVGCQFFHLGPTARVLRDAVLGAAGHAGPTPRLAERRLWLDDVVGDAMGRIDRMTTEMSELTKEE